MSKLLTEKELAERWGVNRLTLLNWRNRGLLPYIALSDTEKPRIRYRLKDIEKYERSNLRNIDTKE